MNIIEIREFCLSLPGTSEYYPFDEHTLAFKVVSKIFLLLATDEIPLRFNAKCDPERAIELREMHESIIRGYHMNKKHWNTLILDGRLSDNLIRELIKHSYDLVFKSLKKTEKLQISQAS